MSKTKEEVAEKPVSKKKVVSKKATKKVSKKKEDIIPIHMVSDGTGKSKIVKRKNGWHRIHPNGTEELIHCV